MPDTIAKRLDEVRPAMILSLVQKARELAAAGHPVIDLGIGEPDFETPQHVKQAAIEAIHNNETRYTVVPGTPALRTAIIDKLQRENGLSYALNQITVSGGAKQIIFNAMNVVQGQCCTHACSISQAASVAALNGPTDFFAERADSFAQRRTVVVAALNAVDGIDCLTPEGAFYVYPDCSGLMGCTTPDGRVLQSDIDLCTWLLEVHHVSAVPGAAFGLSPHMRISTAASTKDLNDACARIAAACATLTRH